MNIPHEKIRRFPRGQSGRPRWRPLTEQARGRAALREHGRRQYKPRRELAYAGLSIASGEAGAALF